jgi:serine/threonine protein kinase/tetratricopeptide (TPR) repeat protein
MKHQLWQRAEDIFHAALERAPEARRAFLDQACAQDTELRNLVDKLISNDKESESFLERPAIESVASELGDLEPPAGRQYGAYRILSLIGAGGMGEVYRAHDTRLGRDVAIKTLPSEFARDPARLGRLRREARMLAALNHPNIAAIYGLETSAEADYLVLELVEGEHVHGPVPLPVALDIAGQVAEALQAAHEHGIVHRDLKPANVKVTPRGLVKVLDFGLGKAIWSGEQKVDPAQPAPATGDETVTGNVLGTPGYMSPEQARGGEVDQRTDIWAFGCLVFEWLAGRRAFERPSLSHVAAAAPELEPDWRALPPRTPPRLRALLRQCLQTEANCRPNDMAAVRASLQELRRAGRRRSSVRIRALAVLPLANLSRDPEQDYFADGMTEALITALAQVGAIRVISRTSAMHYKGTTKTVPEIARELGVDGVIEGSVMREGERVRITAQLVHAATDRHLWAHAYERDLRDVLHLQGEVARAVADEIQVTLTPLERARLARTRPVNVEAHEAYIRGRYDWGRAQLHRSIEHFERAVAIDPDYALAHAGIADAQCRMFGAAVEMVPPTQAAPFARAAALKALELDDSLSEPHVSLSRVLLWYDRDPIGAEREVRRAIQLDSNSAMAHFISGLLFADLGRADEAVSALQRALQLDPVSSWNSAIAGFFLCELNQREAGRRQLRKAIELEPSFFLPWSLSSVIDCYEGKFQDALAAAENGVRLSAGLPMARAYAGYALAMAGRQPETLAILDQLEDLSRQRYVPAIARAWCYVGLGDYERTLEWLEVGYQQRDSHLPHLRLMQAFRPLLPDLRFQDLLRRLGLLA